MLNNVYVNHKKDKKTSIEEIEIFLPFEKENEIKPDWKSIDEYMELLFNGIKIEIN